MKKVTTLILLIAATVTTTAQPLLSLADTTTPPTLYDLSMQPTQPEKVLYIFKTKSQARTWTTVIGYTLIATGGYLGGKAEMKSRYFGTTRNWDTFHVTRDAGIICTGIGAGSIGAGITLGEKPRIREVIWKLASAAILYRVVAEATYHATAPDR